MSMKRKYRPEPRPRREPAENRPRGIVGKQNSVDLDDDIGSESHKKQGLRYFEGQSKAGKNKPFHPEDIKGKQSDPGNDLGEVVDRARKMPYGGRSMGWGANTGKLGDLDPQETDQPSWVGTWSPLQEGPNGAGATRDENYPVQRPRTFSRQRDRFSECNPEFQDVADDGDWTSYKWSEDV